MLEHIGIAVKDLKETVGLFEKVLGVKATGTEEIPHEKVRLSVLEVGNTKLELLEGTHESSPISRYLRDKKGNSIHHIAFEVDDLEQKLKTLEKEGFEVIDGYPKRGKNDSLVAFIHPKSLRGILIELVQTS